MVAVVEGICKLKCSQRLSSQISQPMKQAVIALLLVVCVWRAWEKTRLQSTSFFIAVQVCTIIRSGSVWSKLTPPMQDCVCLFHYARVHSRPVSFPAWAPVHSSWINRGWRPSKLLTSPHAMVDVVEGICKLKCSQWFSSQITQLVKQANICVMNLALLFDVFLCELGTHKKNTQFFGDTGLHFSLENHRTNTKQPK